MSTKVKWQLINMITIKNADIHQYRSKTQHLPIRSQYIIGKQHQLKQHIQPQRHSSQYNPLTITTYTPSSTSITRYHFQPHQNHTNNNPSDRI